MVTFNVELSNTRRKDGRYNIVLRITSNRKHKRKSLGKYINKSDFNPRAVYGKWIRTSNPRNEMLNKYIKGKIEKYELIISGLEKENKSITAENVLKESVKNKTKSFLKYYEDEIQIYRSKKQYRTSEKHKYILQKLKKYLVGKELAFSEFDRSFLKEYHGYLRNKLNNGINTIHTDLKGIKTIFNSAIKDGVISVNENPFLNYVLRTESSIKEKLNFDEIMKIENQYYKRGSKLWSTQNYFLFAFYCAGMRFSDVATLKWENIKDKIIRYRMAKNKKIVEIPLPKQAMKILGFYKEEGVKQSNFVFPILNNKFNYSEEEFLKKQISSKNAIINKLLKIIAINVEINKRITFHVARHSYASFSYQKTKDVRAIKGMLQHSSYEETENYLLELGIETREKFTKEVFGD